MKSLTIFLLLILGFLLIVVMVSRAADPPAAAIPGTVITAEQRATFWRLNSELQAALGAYNSHWESMRVTCAAGKLDLGRDAKGEPACVAPQPPTTPAPAK